jgi:hypothetical protein
MNMEKIQKIEGLLAIFGNFEAAACPCTPARFMMPPIRVQSGLIRPNPT